MAEGPVSPSTKDEGIRPRAEDAIAQDSRSPQNDDAKFDLVSLKLFPFFSRRDVSSIHFSGTDQEEGEAGIFDSFLQTVRDVSDLT